MTNIFTRPPEDQEQAFIVHIEDAHPSKDAIIRDQGYEIEEIKGLTRAISLRVCGLKTLKPSKIQAGAFLGKGHRQQIADIVDKEKPDVVIFNHALSPVQQRNLEREWNVKVIDRTGLILEIFGARAQTKEGRLQVELAALEYQRSRLVRSWTHLERQRGGAGFMGGPGETQIEIDRRLIGERITKLKKDLEDVRRTRDLGRKSRERVPFPTIALVGYTNAGKSTLFNRLTESNVFAEDLPFATLDPTIRRLELPNGQTVILSDTVGFIADLPTNLIAAFRATLEQTKYADMILHVMDVSSNDYHAQKENVESILKDLGIDAEEDRRVYEVWNKIDKAEGDAQNDLRRQANFDDHVSVISALRGEGVDDLLSMIVEHLNAQKRNLWVSVPVTDGRCVSWLYDHAEVLERRDQEGALIFHILMEPHNLGKFADYFGYETHDALKDQADADMTDQYGTH